MGKTYWRDKPTMSIPEAARILGISRSLAYKMAGDGQLPALRLGQRRLIICTAAIARMLEGAGE